MTNQPSFLDFTDEQQEYFVDFVLKMLDYYGVPMERVYKNFDMNYGISSCIRPDKELATFSKLGLDRGRKMGYWK